MYEINHRQVQVQNYDEEQIRTRLRNMDYRTIFYNQPSNSQNTHNARPRNRTNMRRRGTLMALSLIFKNWRRGNSIKPQLLNENCCI